MKVLIIEDEELAVKKLRKTLQSVDDTAEVVGVADSIRSSGQLARKQSRTGSYPHGY